jgi:hypothetical protein
VQRLTVFLVELAVFICPMLFLLAISGNFATDWKFIALTIVGFAVSLFVWIKLRNIK